MKPSRNPDGLCAALDCRRDISGLRAGTQPAVYCSRACRDRAGRQRKRAREASRPFPDVNAPKRCSKRAYHNIGAAIRAARRGCARTGTLIEVYPCLPCRRWHVGHVRRIVDGEKQNIQLDFTVLEQLRQEVAAYTVGLPKK